MNILTPDTYNLIGNILGPLLIGLILWILGERTIDKRMKNEAVRDLMTFRGDYASTEFRRALNRISVTFHKDSAIRKEIRELYEIINNPTNLETNINRKIVGLIYNLCHKNGFEGITEYDIDQAFPETKQSPNKSPFESLEKTELKNNKEVNNQTTKKGKIKKIK